MVSYPDGRRRRVRLRWPVCDTVDVPGKSLVDIKSIDEPFVENFSLKVRKMKKYWR
jgi:hypothetical protein